MMRPVGVWLAAAALCSAQTWFTDSFPTANPAAWTVNGGPLPNSILTGSDISAISTIPPATGADYEVRTSYKIMEPGGSLMTYLRATPNARLGGAGTFYAVELSNLNPSAQTCTVTVWRVEAGVHST